MIARLLEYQRKYGSLKGNEYTAHTRALDTDHALRKEVKELARYFLHREVSNCGWCYIELDLELKKITKEQMEKKTSEYALRPGTILHDPINKDFNRILMPPRLTEELALYHLVFNRQAASYFVATPPDVDKRIAAYLAKQSDEMKARALPSALAALEKFGTPVDESEQKSQRRKKGGTPATGTANPVDESEQEAPADDDPATDPEAEGTQEAPAGQGEE